MSHRLTQWILPIGLIAGAAAILGLSLAASPAAAQQPEPGAAPTMQDMYCSGVFSEHAVPTDTYVISGENSEYRNIYVINESEHVYLNRGQDQGVKVGDEFEIVRAEQDNLQYRWFKWQPELASAMGTFYADIGRLRVVSVEQKTAVAEVEISCDGIQRGDIVRPFTPRPAPAFHGGQFDFFAPSNGKKMAMIVTTKHFGQMGAFGSTVYVNLGSSQGVQVGNYFRVFRYHGTRYDSVYQPPDTAFKAYGFGSTPTKYYWDNLPRQILGEGIVLRTGENSSTVLLTFSHEEIYAGDYVEIE